MDNIGSTMPLWVCVWKLVVNIGKLEWVSAEINQVTVIGKIVVEKCKIKVPFTQ